MNLSRALLVLVAAPAALFAASCSLSEDTPTGKGDAGSSSTDGAAPLPSGDGSAAPLDDAGIPGATPDANGYACAKHAPTPEIKFWGGPILTEPEMVTITYASMDPTTRKTLEDFTDTCTQSAWWDTTMKGYCDATGKCIGHGTAGKHVVLADPDAQLSLTDSQDPSQERSIVTYIQAHIDSGEFPTPNDQTLYSIFLPPGITISLDGASSCGSGFGGYHFAGEVTPKGGGAKVIAAYAIMPTCSTSASATSLIGVASHEYLEAATDAKSLGPEIRNAAWGYYMEDPAWGILWSGQEVADLCSSASASTIGSTSVARGWLRTSPECSSPCGPASPADNWYGVAPEKQVIELAIGESADVALTGFAEKPTPDWTVTLVEPAQGAFSQSTPGYGDNLSLTLSGSVAPDGGKATVTANNGTKLTMHVTLLKAPPEDANYPSQTNTHYNHAFAYVASRLASAKRPAIWPFTVRQKP